MSKSTRPLPPSESLHRGRAPSLSIARSPAVLSSSSFVNQSPHSDVNQNPIPSSSSFQHSSGSHPQSTSGLSRSLSRPKPTLSDIPSEEETPLTNLTEYTKSVTFDHLSDVDSEESAQYSRGQGVELGGEDEGGTRYQGGFQSPDSRELIGIGLSIAGVGVLALAAGLTTVLNWVL